LALITEGARNNPEATRASSSRSVRPILNQAGVHVDRARQRDPVNRQLLFVDAIRRETGEQNPISAIKPDDEAQPNPLAYSENGKLAKKRSAVRRGGNEPKQDQSQPSGLMKERSSLRN